jgi:hypothetical protein
MMMMIVKYANSYGDDDGEARTQNTLLCSACVAGELAVMATGTTSMTTAR